MKTDSSKPIDRDAVITALRRAVEAAGGKRITLRQFVSASGMSHEDVIRNFARWGDVFTAAGYNLRRHNEFIEEARLLEDWGTLARDLQRQPTKGDYKIKGKFSLNTFTTRFGGWMNVPLAFREFSKEKPEWEDIQPLLLAAPLQRGQHRKRTGRITLVSTGGRGRKRYWAADQPWGRRVSKETLYGARLNHPTLQHAPINESGVILLFGAMAEQLGFCVETVRAAFPDCEAKRLVGPELWKRLRIEFEYESRNFKLHGHDPKGCEIIVCWVHNWPECPKNLEVIALKDELQRLSDVKHEARLVAESP